MDRSNCCRAKIQDPRSKLQTGPLCTFAKIFDNTKPQELKTIDDLVLDELCNRHKPMLDRVKGPIIPQILQELAESQNHAIKSELPPDLTQAFAATSLGSYGTQPRLQSLPPTLRYGDLNGSSSRQQTPFSAPANHVIYESGLSSYRSPSVPVSNNLYQAYPRVQPAPSYMVNSNLQPNPGLSHPVSSPYQEGSSATTTKNDASLALIQRCIQAIYDRSTEITHLEPSQQVAGVGLHAQEIQKLAKEVFTMIDLMFSASTTTRPNLLERSGRAQQQETLGSVGMTSGGSRETPLETSIRNMYRENPGPVGSAPSAIQETPLQRSIRNYHIQNPSWT